MPRISDERLEAATRAVAKALGWKYTGADRIIDRTDNPRVVEFIAVAKAALTARPPRTR